MPPVARPERHNARVIAHVDMDCFYVQVEQRRNPELRGLPTAVVQYNAWKGGGLIAVGYEARKFGVKRSMRGDDAKRVCPDIQLVQVPVARGKADLNVYRSAGSEVVSILAVEGRCERASIDEVYLDLTNSAESMLLESPPEMLETINEEALKSHVLGLNSDDNEREKSVREWFSRSDADHQDKLLACGAIIVAQLRIKVLKETEFTCSAGVAHNKMLAKLASAMHKPAQQTVVPSSAVNDLLASLPVKKMKQLGGKLGSSLQSDLGVNTIGDLLKFSKEKLQEHYGVNTGGINGDGVEDRLLPKSHGCGKTFPGPQALKTFPSVENWLNKLCEELSERIQSDLDENKRIAHTLTLHARAFKGNDMDPQKKFPSKSCPLRYGAKKIQEDAMKLFDSALHDFLGSQNVGWGVTALSVSASKIADIPRGTCSILRFLEGKNTSFSSTHCSNGYLQESVPSSSLDVVEESVPSSSAGREGCTIRDQEVRQLVVASEVSNVNNDEQLQDKSLHKEGTLGRRKDVGASSILRFFEHSKFSVPAANQASDGLTHEQAPMTLSPERKLLAGFGQEKQGTFEQFAYENSGRPSQSQNRNDSWAYDVKDIDLSIVDELPEEIQREVRGWLHPPKRANTSSKGSTIAHYFMPSKKS